MGCRQILLDPKTKAWVDEQNKIKKEKGPKYGRSYNEGEDSMYPDPKLDAGSTIKAQKGGATTTLKRKKRPHSHHMPYKNLLNILPTL